MANEQTIREAIRLLQKVSFDFNLDDVYFVGGYPRSMAMGLPLTDVHDLDIASGHQEKVQELAGLFAAEAGIQESYHIHHRQPTVTLQYKDIEIDFQGAISHDEVSPYVRMNRIPVTPVTLNIFDRDFTVNALAIKFGTDTIVDFTKQGKNDIKNKIVRTIIPADIKVEKDPLIITRAIKLAAKYNFNIEGSLWRAMRRNVNNIDSKLSTERLAIESYILSKYPKSKIYLDMLGISFMEESTWVDKGKKLAEE